MYLGLATTFHDSAIAIVDDGGQLVFAEATERHMQSKRAMNIRPDAVFHTAELIRQYCADADEIVPAYSWSHTTPRLYLDELQNFQDAIVRMRGMYRKVPEYLARRLDTTRFTLQSQAACMTEIGAGLHYDLSQIEPSRLKLQPARYYDHHRTHAAAACLTSDFQDAVCAVVDGYGEGRSFACYRYSHGALTEIDVGASGSLASLGLFFMDVCDACGFGQLRGEEWKVMGLAAYGEMDEAIYAVLSGMIRVEALSFQTPDVFTLTKLQQQLHKLRRKSGDPAITMRNLAYAGQRVFSEALCTFLRNLHAATGAENLVLSGGCALNSSANGRLLELTPFKNLFVFSAPADDGNAVGAALLAHREDHPNQPPTGRIQSAYLGSSMAAEDIERLRSYGPSDKLIECQGRAPEIAAEYLAQGKIIGWIQGRAEFGPRALGNRSILADPRSASVKDAINARVKFREEFRPFAPAILDEFGDAYFSNYRASPYMERTLRFRPEVVSRVPGVVHVDGTGRLQSVRREWNERFHRLVQRFYELTDVPIVLNTSFNVMGKPIAHSVHDVLAVFYTSGLDAVFIEDLMIVK